MTIPHEPGTVTADIGFLPFFIAFIGIIALGLGIGWASKSMGLGFLIALGVVLLLWSAIIFVVKTTVGIIAKIIISKCE